MEFTLICLQFVFFYVLLPVLCSALALVVIGGFTFIVLLIPYLLMRYGLGAIFQVIDKVPILGRLIIGAAGTVVGIAMSAVIFLAVFIPLAVTILSALQGGPNGVN